jgi:GNAT superfamily N-acetyltransferase
MTKTPTPIQILDVHPHNVAEAGIYCIKDKKSPGYAAKVEWFKSKINKGLRIKIALDESGHQVGFIEYLPAELAWRPIKARHYFFIQCIALFVKEAKDKGIGSYLMEQCVVDARANNQSGVCAMSSEGPWIANKSLYEKNGFVIVDQLDRFELMVKSFDDSAEKPCFVDWTKQQAKYKGWHLVYSDQCPWHDKAIHELRQCAADKGIGLTVKKLKSPKEAQLAPSGFGTFSLIKDGKLLADLANSSILRYSKITVGGKA